MGIRKAGTTVGVAVVDYDERLRLSFKGLLETSKDFRAVGMFSNAAEALAGIPSLRPDLALMDLHLPDLNGVECIKQLKKVIPALKIVIATGTRDPLSVSAASKAGAAAYLIKPINLRQFWATLSFASADTAEIRAVEEIKPGSTPAGGGAYWQKLRLNPREREILTGLANGMLYKEIADRLSISYAAVHKSQHKIYKKLRVSNRSEAIRIWLGMRGNLLRTMEIVGS